MKTAKIYLITILLLSSFSELSMAAGPEYGPPDISGELDNRIERKMTESLQAVTANETTRLLLAETPDFTEQLSWPDLPVTLPSIPVSQHDESHRALIQSYSHM